MEILSPADSFKIGGCYLEITSQCNLRCLHCYNESGTLQNKIEKTTFMEIIDDLPNDVATSITISGGEPTTHPEFWDFLDELEKKNFGNVLIITNGTFITEKNAEKFSNYNIGLQLSINGSNSEVHDRLCGRGSFYKTIRGLDNLIQAGMSKNIIVRSVLTNFNKNDIVSLIRMLVSKNILHVEIAALSALGRSENNMNDLYIDIEEKAKLVRSWEEEEEIVNFIKRGANITFPDEFTGLCPLLMNVTKEDKRIPLTPRIDSSGNVYLCQLFTDVQYSIGNVHQNNISAMLQSPALSNLIGFFRTGQTYMNKCQTCIWNRNCGKGCIAMAVANGGSIQDTDGCCSPRKNYFISELNKKRKSLVSR
ncbi:UNVERIFIED_CONTAM: radical SAM protein with 4Fe4S-binding SPASM domain [Paenibacillus sp. PvR008]